MPNIVKHGQIDPKPICDHLKQKTSYRGFASIDQEIEREIAMQWFNASKKSSFSQRNFLLKKRI